MLLRKSVQPRASPGVGSVLCVLRALCEHTLRNARSPLALCGPLLSRRMPPFMKFAVKFIFYAINIETTLTAEIGVIVMLLRYRKL